jgi:hypothetical protein
MMAGNNDSPKIEKRLQNMKKEVNKICEKMYGPEWPCVSNPLTNMTCYFDEAISFVEGDDQ